MLRARHVALLSAISLGVIGTSASAADGTAPVSSAPSPTSERPVHELIDSRPGGLTAEVVGLRAAKTSYSARAAEENVRAAAAHVDAAWAAFLPRLTATARYTRLSKFTPPSLAAGSLVGTLAPPGTVNPPTTAIGSLSFPLVLDNYLLQASIVVPVSDYFLKINQAYSAATHSRDAARYDAIGARAKSATEGKLAYYSWLRARGATRVAQDALVDQQAHYSDAQHVFDVGSASRADVLRAETSVAAAELQIERSSSLVAITEKQVQLATHSNDNDKLVPGETLETPLPPIEQDTKALEREAFSQRMELRSIDANIAALRNHSKAAIGSALPSLSGFANGYYSNPNIRRFPMKDEWFPSWDVGAQLVWTPNDAFSGRFGANDFNAQAAALEAQRVMMQEAIALEVLQAVTGAKEAHVAISTAARELASASEAYRVARELFKAGRAISATLTDAQTELTRARLDALNAAVDARVARVKLDHAVGRDAKQLAMAP